jgi:hypothetical protein
MLKRGGYCAGGKNNPESNIIDLFDRIHDNYTKKCFSDLDPAKEFFRALIYSFGLPICYCDDPHSGEEAISSV